jgi:hypothetical protein
VIVSGVAIGAENADAPAENVARAGTVQSQALGDDRIRQFLRRMHGPPDRVEIWFAGGSGITLGNSELPV